MGIYKFGHSVTRCSCTGPAIQRARSLAFQISRNNDSDQVDARMRALEVAQSGDVTFSQSIPGEDNYVFLNQTSDDFEQKPY